MYHDGFSGITGKHDIPCLRKVFEGKNGEAIINIIPLQAIFEMVEAGTFFPSETLTEKDIRKAQTFAAMHMPDRPEFKRNNRYKRTKLLLDENLPSGLIPGLSKELSNISHIYFEGMNGNTDEFIYWRPWSKLKTRSSKEARAHDKTKYIIISQDSDLTDIAKRQWLDRMLCCAEPEKIDFSNVNVVFHVKDITLRNPASATMHWPSASDILRAAYSGEASSYIITKGGVYPEAGCSKQEIITQIEEIMRNKRLRNNELILEDIEYVERQKALREARRTRSQAGEMAIPLRIEHQSPLPA
jgi:predicted nuclease of predicted toxin-antitoxin system